MKTQVVFAVLWRMYSTRATHAMCVAFISDIFVPTTVYVKGFIQFAKTDRYLRQGGYVMRFVCMFVCLFCLLATLRKNYRTDLHETFTTDVSVDREERGSRQLPDPDPGIFFQDSSTLRDGAFFHNLAHISGKAGQIFVKILPQM